MKNLVKMFGIIYGKIILERICYWFVFKLCVVFINVGFIFCNFGKIINMIIGILKVICDIRMEINFNFMFKIVKKIKKLVLIIMFGLIINILFKFKSEFFVNGFGINLIVSVL